MSNPINLEFSVVPDDLKEATLTLLGTASRNPETNLVNLVQYALYDNADGSQLNGHFVVKVAS